jgi:hypothetical protein
VVQDNVFREAYGMRDGAKVVYFLRSPIRVWHVDGDTMIRGNVIEQAQQGITLECRSGSQAGCNAGTTRVTDNTIGGQVRDLGGTLRQVNTTAGVLAYQGLQAQATFDGNVFALVPQSLRVFVDGLLGAPVFGYVGNRDLTAAPAGARLDLRPATPATDPDLSYAQAYR